MSWNPHMEVHYIGSSSPYNTAGSFMEYFEGLTYEHVNFIFSGVTHAQEVVYPSSTASYYKFGFSDSGSNSYYDHAQDYEVHDYVSGVANRRGQENPSMLNNGQSSLNSECVENVNSTTHDTNVECPWRHHNPHDYQVVLHDNLDPDNMTYEELLDLGETVGTQSRGLSKELIALLPISKYKCRFFFGRSLEVKVPNINLLVLKKEKSEPLRCVICQMEYRRGDRRITLPCNHLYHVGCGTKWLSINKACPICYTEVFGDASKH